MIDAYPKNAHGGTFDCFLQSAAPAEQWSRTNSLYVKETIALVLSSYL